MFKRGQTQQIFVWLVVLVVAVSILFFGIKLIKKTENLKDDALIVKFFNDLEKKLNQYYYLDRGSSGNEKFLLPSDAKEVCFVNSATLNDDTDQKIHYFFQLKDYSNVFVMPNTLYENSRYKLSIRFKVTDNNGEFECFRVINGVLNINLENEGVNEGVKISQ